MITLKRNGVEFTISEEDQKTILKMTLANGGDLQKAMAEHFEQKFGEPINPRDKRDGNSNPAGTTIRS